MKVCITNLSCLVKVNEWNVEWLRETNAVENEMTKKIYISIIGEVSAWSHQIKREDRY